MKYAEIISRYYGYIFAPSGKDTCSKLIQEMSTRKELCNPLR